MSFNRRSNDVFEWKPIDFTINSVKYAVLILNHSLDHLNGGKSQFNTVWRKAERRYAVDGGAKYLDTKTGEHKFPDILCGDFDSVSEELREYFRANGTEIIETPDQNYTDFTKAVQLVVDSNKSLNKNKDNNNRNDSQNRIESIIAIWSSEGRIDQVLSNINTLYMNGQQLKNDNIGQYVPIFLLQVNGSVSWLLNKGTHVIESNHSSKWCSLVPMGTACCVTTTGFRWNLNNQVMSFGSLISTSNEFDKNEKQCRIETDSPLFFSMDISNSNQI